MLKKMLRCEFESRMDHRASNANEKNVVFEPWNDQLI